MKFKKEEIKSVKIESKKDIESKKLKKARFKKGIYLTLILSFIVFFITLIFSKNFIPSGIAFVVTAIFYQVYLFLTDMVKSSLRIKKMEEVFPDFIELMASNLRAGMTIDKALLYSSRKEFSPLDEEILNLGKDILTGKEISTALVDMTKRIKSDKIYKTIIVINSGIRSGGNLAIILEQTASNMRDRNFIEKRAASNVLMYLIFIFFAVAIGAPALFGLSSILVEILTKILGNIPQIDAKAASNLPLTLTSINISVNFIIYFSIAFLISIDIMAALLLGLVNKGEEKAGAKYIPPLVIVSISVFFLVRTFLLSQFADLIG